MSDPLTDADALIRSLEAGTAERRVSQSLTSTTGQRVNPYVTDNSSARESFDGYTDRMDALFNDRPAYQAVLRESPRHRLILWMTAQGHSPQQIADALGITRQTVYIVRKQPWFREMFVRLTADIGRDSVTTLLKTEVLPSLQTLIEIRDDPSVRPADRRGAADSLLDRFLGKPVAKTSEGTAPSDLPTEVSQLANEAARISEELKSQGLDRFVPSPS